MFMFMMSSNALNIHISPVRDLHLFQHQAQIITAMSITIAIIIITTPRVAEAMPVEERNGKRSEMSDS